MATYANGRIPQSALAPVPAITGTAWLLPAVADAWLRVVAEVIRVHGWAPAVTSAGDGFRSYDAQVRVFQSRYSTTYATVLQGGRRIVDRRVWAGVPYWRHTGAAAAVPGTSNHGKGITVDVSGLGAYTSLRFAQFATIAGRYGWSNAEGRTVGEPWHWSYTGTTQTVSNTNTLPGVTITTPTGTTPDPLTPEDDMANVTDAQLDTLVRAAERLLTNVEPAVARLDTSLGAQGETTGKIDQIKQWTADIRGGLEGLPGIIVALDGLTETELNAIATRAQDLADARARARLG